MLATLLDVQEALATNTLVPCFQPLVELRSGLLTGFEVLARWQHPRLGLILPQNFIHIAEESGLIKRLTQQILRKAFHSAAGLPAPLSLSVNISPVQFRDPDLPAQVRQAAVEAGFPLTQLTIEITESALFENLEIAGEAARELKAMGCRLSLDDFGTGYSSLLHLQALPFDQLKVDRSFIHAMTTRRESRKIVGAVVGLGHSLGVVTVAEGVETEEQAEMLLRLGCNVGQGWLFGRPAAAEFLPEMIAAPPRTFARQLSDRGESLTPFLVEALPAQQVAQLRAIYDGVPAGLCFLDRNLRYICINRRLAEINGAPAIAHLGKTPAEMVPDVYPQIEPFLRSALQGSSTSGVEVVRPGLNPGDPERTLLLSYEPAFDEAGETIGISVGAVDVTSRRRVDDAACVDVEQYPAVLSLGSWAN